MEVRDVMTREVQSIWPDASLRDAARRMDEFNVGILPVVDAGRVVGVLTDRDIAVRSVAAGDSPQRTRVREVMTESVRCCTEDCSIAQAEALMSELQVRRLPVVGENHKLVGIVSLGDLAADHVPGAGETLSKISEPAEPDLSGTPSTRNINANGMGGVTIEPETEAMLSAFDHRLRGDIQEALAVDPDLDATNIHVIVRGGRVLLTGTTGTEEDISRAMEDAKSVEGATDLQCDLRVQTDLTPSHLRTGA